MKPETFDIIRQTVPLLEQHGEQLADCFYKNMFRNNPEVNVFFNPAHQQSGAQQHALATTICTYARHIDNPSELRQAFEVIFHKHVSLGIKPEHYPIVGNNLLLTLREVLGEAAPAKVIESWTEAYGVLAGIFIDREDDLYQQQQSKHGWNGFKAFTLIRRHSESSNITSFYLRPTDNKPLKAYLPGQYITLKVKLADGSQAMRNYSLSSAPREDYFRISVKKHTGELPDHPGGVVSNRLHDNVQVGEQLLLAPPIGNFILRLPEAVNKPLVFIAGGIGITPLLAMLHSGLAHEPERSFTLIQLARNNDVLPFYEELSVLAHTYPNFQWHIRLSQFTGFQSQYLIDSEGYIDKTLLERLVPEPEANYYLCGPAAMIQTTMTILKELGVDSSSIAAEFFGPSQSLTD
jgi:nitric oxide dioxygenase